MKRPLPDFSLIERSGEALGRDQLKGKIWLANFIFTTCPGQCIVLSNNFREFQESIRELPDVRLVSFTVDPETDTPEQLQKFAEQYQAGDQWLFATGDRETIYELIRDGFLLIAEENPRALQPGEEKVLHTAKVALVDRNGHIRKYYDGLNPDLYGEILGDLKKLSAQPKPTSS